ncbi:hypothetical protein EVAR_99546_1 [Eumeta japonica]|uniref:Uncharacterized protein n=1 Tax=Eumeta variegata TaxID=151549 RepID=A0A4C1YWH8_EUMVA|nr:hypothetical protein EVAR_99546_1 [Eumeta japonica]
MHVRRRPNNGFLNHPKRVSRDWRTPEIEYYFFFESTLEKEAKLLHPPRSPNTSQSNNSTLETKSKGGIKKMITEKIITTTTLERNKKEKKDGHSSTLERENEKNSRLINKSRLSDVPAMNKPDRNRTRHSASPEVTVVQRENGVAHTENAEVQKREFDPKRGMKFGIRVLPPNVPDDGVLKASKNVENGVITIDKRVVDEPDRPQVQASVTEIKHENEIDKGKPVVAKRREKMAPPVPNARVKLNESDMSSNKDNSRTSETTVVSSFSRDDLNSSGIKRDENGIPQELPQHMLEAAMAARNNRKSVTDVAAEKDVVIESKKEEVPKSTKKSKGKAPSPPEHEKNKTEENILEQLNKVNDFLKSEKQHSSVLHTSNNSTDRSTLSFNTSTPKSHKMKGSSHIDESINFTQDDIDDIVSKPFKKESDSLNNFFEDSKSNLSSNQDIHSVVSYSNTSDKSDRGSTTIELNNSDITIHSSPLDDTVRSASDEASTLDENERKAASLGDLSKFELRVKTSKPSTGTLERAQSLDISADDAEITESTISPKKRKAFSVVETNYDVTSEDILHDMTDPDAVVIKHKEPRLSLNIAKPSAMEGLNTFQRNRLKKGSEFGNLEDAIVKGSSSSIDSDKTETNETVKKRIIKKETADDLHESSDHLARRIMDENLKVHLKLVSEFAKSTSDSSNMSSLDGSQEMRATSPLNSDITSPKYDNKLNMNYDTNIPDDMKVSRSTYVNSLERPKSEMMKKLLAKNPILNVHIDQSQKSELSMGKETPTPMTDASKSAMNQPDIVTFDLKDNEQRMSRDYDDFVSNIKVGSANNSLKYSKPTYEVRTEWKERAPVESKTSNIVTISTNDKLQTVSSDPSESKYTKSIEISDRNVKQIPDVIEGIKRRSADSDEIVRKSRALYMEPQNFAITMTQEPIQKNVTVNVVEDEFGNKVITQNIEKTSSKYVTTKTEAPLQVEQITFGIMKSPSEIRQLELEENAEADIDAKILEEIKRQNPNMHFTTDEPAYSKTETIILNTQMDEEQAMALMEKLKRDPSFMSQKTPDELSRLGIRIIRDLDDVQTSDRDGIEVTKTRYTINPKTISDSQKCTTAEETTQGSAKAKRADNREHITEIQVVTPKTEKLMNQQIDSKEKSREIRRQAEPLLSYELDISLLDDFISNERHHSAKQLAETRQEKHDEPKKRHSDFDLPRNTHIKFTTSTYESPKGTLVTSTDLENRRLSQLDQQRTHPERTEHLVTTKPAISAKPSNIPVKADKKIVINTSKIPVFTSQKSLSSENLTEKNFSLPRSPPPKLSSSSGNISVTSIKSSSKNPSGK